MSKSRRRLSFASTTAMDEGKKCALCHNPHTQFSAPMSWKNVEVQKLAVTSLGLTDQCPVCRLCRDDIGRMVKNPDTKPRWEKNERKENCCIPMCGNVSFTISKIASSEQVSHIFQCDTLPHPTPLCKQHYHNVYEMLQPKNTHCCTCNATLRNVQRRTCPNPKEIQKYLVENTGFDGTIPEDGRVCPSCYKAQLVILKQKPNSTDTDLQLLITTLKQKLVEADKDITEHTMQYTAIYVAEQLLKQECLLLSSVKQKYTSIMSTYTQQDNTDNKPTTQWLLSNLIVYLQYHISYTCSVRKHGTLLYRSNGNLLLSISHLLYKSTQTSQQMNEEMREQKSDKETESGTYIELSNNTEQCSPDELNSLLHKQITRNLATDLNAPYPFHALSIEKQVSEIDPTLWAFIKSITRSISDRRGYNTKANQPNTLQHHVKQVRQLFCLSALMFCTDDRCSVPLHTLITDAIESGGGSTQLIRMLNRMGICSSVDTLARSIQFRVREREIRGPEEQCISTLPTVISADNIDFQHSYARVFCGKQTSSWHGMTDQAVQPVLAQHCPMHESLEPAIDALPCPCSPSTRGECTTADANNRQESRHIIFNLF